MPALNPKVSICIPAYEYPDLLERCLNSVLDQTFTDFEVVITDDSSHDRLKDVVGKIDDRRIFYYKNAVPLGSPANWNEGIKFAKGEYIKILHHDDWFSSSTALQRFVSAFDNDHNTAFVFSNCYNITAHKPSIHSTSYIFLKKFSKTPEVCLFLNAIGAPSVTMFKREVAKIPFDINLKWYVDVVFYVEVCKKFKQVAHIEEPLLKITAGSNNQVTNTTSRMRKIKEAIYAFNHFGYFKRKSVPLLLQLLFVELFRRYKIKRFADLEGMGFDRHVTERLRLYFSIAKLPVHFKVYALIRRIIINYIPI